MPREVGSYRSSPRRVATVDHEFAAGNELCFFRGEIDDSPADVAPRPESCHKPFHYPDKLIPRCGRMTTR